MTLQIQYNNQIYKLNPEFYDLKASELASILQFTEQQLMFHQIQSLYTQDGTIEHKFRHDPDASTDEAFIDVNLLDLDKIYEVKISDLREIHVDRLTEDELYSIKEDFTNLIEQVKGQEYRHSVELERMSVALQEIYNYYDKKCEEKCDSIREKCQEMITKNPDKREKYQERCSKKLELTRKKFKRRADSFRNSDVDRNEEIEWKEFLASEALHTLSQRLQRRTSFRRNSKSRRKMAASSGTWNTSSSIPSNRSESSRKGSTSSR